MIRRFIRKILGRGPCGHKNSDFDVYSMHLPDRETLIAKCPKCGAWYIYD